MKKASSSISVLVVEPGKHPYQKEIPATLEAMQGLVGGLIEVVYPWPDSPAVLICNEEGKINGLPLNRYVPSIQDVICGTFFACDGSEEEFQTLSDEEMKKIQEQFHSPEYFWNQYGTLFIHRCRPDEYDKLMAKHR